MTVDLALYHILQRCKHTATTVSLDRRTALILLNKALQTIYPLALAADQTFYTAKQTIAATGTITVGGSDVGKTFELPEDHYKTLLVEVTAASEGAARIAGHREFLEISHNTFVKGNASNPVARIDSTTLEVRPASITSVTLHYIWQFPFIDDEARELSKYGEDEKAIIPWVFEEAVILEACRLARVRHNMISDAPALTGVAQLAGFDSVVRQIERGAQPMEIYGADIPTPK